jgi:hypothetical protein
MNPGRRERRNEMPEIHESAPLMSEDRIANITASKTYTYTVNVSEYLGRVQLSWSHDCPCRPQSCWVGLYKSTFPTDPNTGIAAFAWAEQASGTFLTNEPWGSGWCAAMVAHNGYGKYAYMVKTGVTG